MDSMDASSVIVWSTSDSSSAMDSAWVVVGGNQSLYDAWMADEYIRYLLRLDLYLIQLFDCGECAFNYDLQVSEECEYWSAVYRDLIIDYHISSGLVSENDSLAHVDFLLE